MRVVFFGTPDFAAVSLRRLIEENYDIAGVFCQPDRPSGRKMEIVFSPVKQLACDNAIPVFQPDKMRDGTAYEILKKLKPDICVVVAFGRIIPENMLEVPPLGMINVHGSLLPAYRGSAPIQWSVINGDEFAGVTTMYLDKEMDTGDIIYSESTRVGEYETSGELYDRLAVKGADLLIKTLNDIEKGTAPRTPQDNSKASYVTMLDKSISPIDFSLSQREIIKKIYGLQPWPVAVAKIGDETLKIFKAEYTDNVTEMAPGSIVSTNGSIEIACGGGKTVKITEVQAPGKKRMNAADYLRGHHLL